MYLAVYVDDILIPRKCSKENAQVKSQEISSEGLE